MGSQRSASHKGEWANSRAGGPGSDGTKAGSKQPTLPLLHQPRTLGNGVSRQGKPKPAPQRLWSRTLRAKAERVCKLLRTCSSWYREFLGPEGKGSSHQGHTEVWKYLLRQQAYPAPLRSSRWLYEGLSREKAEELLLLPGNPGGAFLIRESQTRRGG